MLNGAFAFAFPLMLMDVLEAGRIKLWVRAVVFMGDHKDRPY